MTTNSFKESYINAEIQRGLDQIYEYDFNKYEPDRRKPHINEAVGPLFIISIILAMPKALELLAKGIRALITGIRKLLKMKEKESNNVVDTIIKYAHKWHKSYIKAIKYILIKAKVYEKAKITDEKEQERAAEVVFYTVIFGFAVYGGFASFSAISKAVATADIGHASFASVETAVTAIKTAEIKEFMHHVL